jgi:hypothetical protein
MKIILFLVLCFSINAPHLNMGRYSTIKKHQTIVIQINDDSTFVYHKGTYLYSYGKWKIDNNDLIISSTKLTSDDSLMIAITGGTYFKIDKMCFLIEDNAIKDKETKVRYILEN